jgi:hypothetical protein
MFGPESTTPIAGLISYQALLVDVRALVETLERGERPEWAVGALLDIQGTAGAFRVFRVTPWKLQGFCGSPGPAVSSLT